MDKGLLVRKRGVGTQVVQNPVHRRVELTSLFDDLARELREGLICPVLLGVASRANGVLRLLKALRHEAPTVEKTAARLKVADGKDGAPAAR